MVPMTNDERERVARLLVLSGGIVTELEGCLKRFRELLDQLRQGTPARDLPVDDCLQTIAHGEHAIPTTRRILETVRQELL